MTITQQRRLHRSRAADYLASLQAAAKLEVQPDIEWESLEAVPHWCFEPPDYVNKLQLVSGAVFLAPAIRNWIDGKRIQQVRALIGPIAFDAVMRSTDLTEISSESDVTEEVPEALARGGAAVLLGSMENTDVRALVATQFPMSVEPIDHSVAKAVYEISLNIVHQAIVAEKIASNAAQGTPENQSPSQSQDDSLSEAIAENEQ